MIDACRDMKNTFLWCAAVSFCAMLVPGCISDDLNLSKEK